MKRRQLTQCGIDIVGAFGMVAWVDIGFGRPEGDRRQRHILGVDGLAADDNNFAVIRYLTRRPDDMFQL